MFATIVAEHTQAHSCCPSTRCEYNPPFILCCFIFWHTFDLMHIHVWTWCWRCTLLTMDSRLSFYQLMIHTNTHQTHTYTPIRWRAKCLEMMSNATFFIFCWLTGCTTCRKPLIWSVVRCIVSGSNSSYHTAISQLIFRSGSLSLTLYIYVMCEKWSLNVFH